MGSRKTSMQKNRIPTLDLLLFSPWELAKDDGIVQANLNLEKVVYSGGASQAISDLLSSQNQFEFVFSVINDDVAQVLRQDMVDNFPGTAIEFAASHLQVTLPRLASFLYFLSTEFQKTRSLIADYRSATTVPIVLNLLFTSSFGEQHEANNALAYEEGDDVLVLVKKKQNQRQLKQQKMKIGPTLDLRLIDALRKIGSPIPSTKQEAVDLEQNLLLQMKIILCDFLDLLRSASWARAIRDAYIPPITLPQATGLDDGGDTEAIEDNTLTSDNPKVASDNPQVASDNWPPAFPTVQPLKAALHFDNAKGFGKWRIFISSKAEKHLREHRKNPKTFTVIVKKIKELSHGHFSNDNQKRLKGPDRGVPIFEAKMTGDLRLVYQVDCASDFESEVEWQGLRIFGIFTHAQMDKRMWESLSAQLAKKGLEYRRRVILRSRPTITGDNVFEPLSWPDHSIREDETSNDTALLSLIRTDDLPKIHQWIVLEKYTAFSQTLLNCIIADKAASAVFSVSPYERAIIEHTSSCFVLGRSGTGKTTTMLFKIFGIERAARNQPMSVQGKPRQLFVTQSRVLAGRVKDYYDKLSDFLNAAFAKSLTELKELGQTYHEAQDDDGMGNPEDDEEWKDDLPKRFSELEDKHFPLFLTFDKLCKLLEADQGLSFGRHKYAREHKRAEMRSLSKVSTTNYSMNAAEATSGLEEGGAFLDPPISNEHLQASLVSFESFCARYWPHFPQNLTKGLNTALVFNEFIGVIKGSEECLLCEKPYLPREMYLGLSDRAQSTFASQRNRVYELFLSYLKLKQQYDNYDAADRSFSIINHIKDTHFKGVDYLYVDEAQDNLIIDALLLRSLCTNPDGLFWAGDTAQTIAVGSSFRFDDLKASLHRYETLNQGRMSQKHSTCPASFQLTTNYRSHGGIVNCAEMVIRLIKNFWPHSIDVLSQEKGLVDGEKPVIITGWDERNARYEQFLLGEDGNQIEFGAQQCILVRHDQARIDLRRQVGEIGVILTLYESKGLEFDDVLLFDFFEDSICDASQWRVILNYGSSTGYGSTPPKFDEVRHAGICTELKFLYVAMTRARKNLWIIDRSEKVEPMKLLLSANGRITVCTPEMAPKLSVSSTAEEWGKTGKELFRNQRYSQAMHCLDRAGLSYEKSIAEAFYLRQQARIQSSGRRAAFSVAATAFSSCATDSPSPSKKKSYHHIAAECFREADDYGAAAREFLHAEEYGLASLFFRKAGMFDDAISVIKANRENVDHALAEEIIEVSKLHFLHEDKIESALELFETEEDGLDFMEEFGFNTARSKILEALGRKYDAAELFFSEGHQEDAMRLLLSESEDIRCMQRASRIILNQLWKKYAFSATARISSQGEIDYEPLAESLDKSRVDDDDRKQLEIFSVIKKSESSELYRTQDIVHQCGDFLNATLVLNHYLRKVKGIEVEFAVDLVPVLKAYGRYAGLLRSLLDTSHTDPKFQKLMGFTPLPETPEFAIGRQSMLYTYVTEKEIRGHSAEDEFIVHELDMPALIKTSITKYLLEIVREQNQWITKTRVRLFGTPCLAFATRGSCFLVGCQREHVDTKAVDAQWFNLRVRLHYLQILHVKAAEFVLGEREWRDFRGKWVANLFEILHPSTFGFGSVANLSRSFIPEMQEAIKTITYWLDDLSYHLNSRDAVVSSLPHGNRRSRAFLDDVVELSVIGLDCDAPKFRTVARRSRFFDQRRAPPELFRQGHYVIHDIIYFIDTHGPHFLDRGLLFVEHVLNLDLPMEITLICYLLERLCSCFVLICSYQSSRLHNCTLPRSWIQLDLRKLDLTHRVDLQHYDLSHIWRFLDILIRVMQLLTSTSNTGENTAASNLLNLADANFRNTSISRICRCIVLLGYNFRNYDFREKIIGVFNDMRRILTYPPWPLKQPGYIYCKNWTGFKRIVHTRIPMTKLDSMIQLVHKGEKAEPLLLNSTIVCIEFKEWENILPTLEREFITSISRLSATAASFVPKMALIPKAMGVEEVQQVTANSMLPSHGFFDDNVLDGLEDNRDQEDEEEEPDQDEEDEIHIEQKLVVIPEEVGAVLAGYSDEEKASTAVIQKWLKVVMHRRVSLLPTTHRQKAMQFNLAHVYETCLKLSAEKTWTSRLQRIIFLGPLPHILVCLDRIQEKLQTDKRRAHNMVIGITKESHMEYDEVLRRANSTRDRRKRFETLKKLFSPASNWHSERDFEELQRKLREVEALINELKLGDDIEIIANLTLAKKAILEERKVTVTSKPQTRPELDTEDI